MRKSRLRLFIAAALVLTAAVVITNCPAADGGGGATGSGDEASVSFSLVTGSGTITINLLDAATLHEGATFYFGTSSTVDPVGGTVSISDNNQFMTIQDTLVDVIFTGGLQLVIGGFIDISGFGDDFQMARDTDWLAFKTVTVAGPDTTMVTLTYPGDFTEVSGSGTVSVTLLGASPTHNGKSFLFGTASGVVPYGNAVVIDGDDTDFIQDEGVPVMFTGDLELEVAGFIDMDDDGDDFHMADNDDWLAAKTITVSGNEIVTMTYPDDFTKVTGSGTVSVLLRNANTNHSGETFYFGTASTGQAFGDSDIITSNYMLLTIQDEEADVIFTGGYEIEVGGFVDTNGNGEDSHMADNGDYYAVTTTTVSGDTLVTMTFE